MDRERALREYGLAAYLYRGLTGRRQGGYRPLSPGTLKGGRQHGLTKARSEGTLSNSNARNYEDFGAGNEPSRRNKPGV